jgi:acetylornithine deacetylase/succinyl-diaminopimelate desuccinylase-like protein
VKLDYLCKAFALRNVDLSRLRKPVHLLATWGEEIGLLGTKAFIASKLLEPEWTLCGEPSELIPCHAHKGYAMAKVRASLAEGAPFIRATHKLTALGKAAHSSTPHLGLNAIEKLCDTLGSTGLVSAIGGSSSNTVPAEASALIAGALPGAEPIEPQEGPDMAGALSGLRIAWDQWTGLAKSLVPAADPEFSPAEVVCNFGVLQAEPGALVGSFDARLLPVHDPDALHANFAEALRAIVPHGVTLTATIERSARGMRAEPESPLLKALGEACAAVGLSQRPKAKATSTEAGAYFHAGCHAAVFGPGVSVGNAHTPNEWNRESDLELATRIYARLIQTLCA